MTRSGPRRQTAVAAVFFAAVAVATTYPLAARIASSLPAGFGDPALITFLLAWDADRIAHGFRKFWEAPFLFPHHQTLAYTEHMLGVALFTAPLQWLTHNPVLVYNIAFLASDVLAGVGMFLLARSLWGRSDAALLAGLAFVLSPYRIGQVTHLQMLMTGWMPLSLWALHRYFAGGSRRMLAAAAAAFLLQALSNGYFLFFFSIAVAVVVACEAVRPPLSRRRLIGDFAGAGAAVMLLLAPFAWMYLSVQRQHAFDRPAEDLFRYAARWSDYFTVPPDGWTWGGLLPLGEPERQLYPGIFALGFAVVGLIGTVRQQRAWRRPVLTYLLVTAAAFWVSLGPGASRPYGVLLRLVPGFSGMRVPARMGLLVHLGLAVLAAAGAATLLARLPRRAAGAVTMALAVLIAVEGRYALSVDPFPPVAQRLDRDVYEWLRTSPPGAAIELRITQQNDFHPFTLFYQFNTLLHRHPIVNGYTGWPSVLQEFLGGPAALFDDPDRVGEVLEGLRAIGVRYLLLHAWSYDQPEQPARIREAIRAVRDQTSEERQFDATVAWRLADPPPPLPRGPGEALHQIDGSSLVLTASQIPDRLPAIVDGNVETRWVSGVRQSGDEWIAIRLPQPGDVARLRLETTPRGLIDYPRHLAIESIDPRGGVQPLFDGSVLPRLIESLASDERRAPIDLDFPPNRTATLRLRQTGRTHRWFWGVHEITLWTR